MAISDYSTDPNANTSISGINVGEGCPAANVNNAFRQMMADLAASGALRLINVKDAPYSAVGDGAADDTAAIQAAITAAEAFTDPAAVFLPTGTYKTSAALTVTRGVKIRGEGRLSTIIRATGTTATGIDANMTTVAEYGFEVSDLSIENTTSTGSLSSGDGIRLRKATFANITNVRIANFFNGLRSTQANLSTVDTLHVETFKSSGIIVDGGLNYNSRFTSCVIGGGGVGLYALALSDMCDIMVFDKCTFSSASYCFFLDASAYGTGTCPEFARFTNCDFDSCTTGGWLNHTTDVLFDNCFFSNRPGNGVQMGVNQAVESTKFIGCYFYANGANGAVIGEYAYDTKFLGCDFIGNSVTTPGSASGLLISQNALDFTIHACSFRNGWGSAGSQAYGLQIATGTSNRYTITNCNFGTNGTGAALLQGTGTNRVIANNIGLVTKAEGSATILNGNSSVVVTHGLAAQPASTGIVITARALPTVAAYISAVGSTTFTISTAGAVGADTLYNWKAAVLGA